MGNAPPIGGNSSMMAVNVKLTNALYGSCIAEEM